MSTRRLHCPIALAARLRAVAGTGSFSPGFPGGNAHQAQIGLPGGREPGGSPGLPVARCPRPREHGRYGILSRRRRGAGQAAPREPGHVRGLRAAVIGLGGGASGQAPVAGAAGWSRTGQLQSRAGRGQGRPGRRRWRVRPAGSGSGGAPGDPWRLRWPSFLVDGAALCRPGR